MLEVGDYEMGGDHQSELRARRLMLMNGASLIVATADITSRLVTTSHVTVTSLDSIIGIVTSCHSSLNS